MLKKNYNILIIEDEWINAAFTSELLENLGHNVVGIHNSADDVMSLIRSDILIDIIFMDINIDGSIDGISLAKDISKVKNIPIVYITAFSDRTTLNEACATNIYGFITKPYSGVDVEVTLGIVIQRMLKENDSMQDIDIKKLNLGSEYTYDVEEGTLYYKNSVVFCSKKESKLLHLFCLNRNHIISLEQIRSTVWPEKEICESAVRSTISRIRKKIPKLNIENISGVGYSLKLCDEE